MSAESAAAASSSAAASPPSISARPCGRGCSCDSGRVRLNVGGRHFETSATTLQADPDCMLARLCAPRWNADASSCHEYFIDRDGRHFHTILNHLRDAAATPLPDDNTQLAELLLEAEYYQVCSLADRCRHKLSAAERQWGARADAALQLAAGQLSVGEPVAWRPDAIDVYWRALAEALVADGIEIPFVYDRVGRKYSDRHGFAVCFACMHRLDLDTLTVFEYKVRLEQWEPLRHHMRHMRGTVAKRYGHTCALVHWDNGATVHLPLSALAPPADV